MVTCRKFRSSVNDSDTTLVEGCVKFAANNCFKGEGEECKNKGHVQNRCYPVECQILRR